MIETTLWPVFWALGAAAGSLFLTWRLTRFETKPGAMWLAATLACQAVFCAVSGVSLLVFDVGFRRLLEMVAWSAVSAQCSTFLAFAIVYSGRRYLISTPIFWSIFTFPLVTAGLILTNSSHHLIWTGFQFDPLYGLATVRYEYTVVGTAFLLFGLFFGITGSMILIDTAMNYSLYRVESVAIALSTVPPGIAAVIWLLGVGPYPQLNLIPLASIPYLLIDGYAILSTDIFEFNPTTRRLTDGAIISHLTSPVVVVNREFKIVNINPAALSVFATTEATALKTDIEALVGASVDFRNLEEGDNTASIRVGGTMRHFAISLTEQTNSAGDSVGYSIFFQDITAQQRREQRLEVLSRVLRHNLRNELNIVVGNLQLASEETDFSPDGGRDERLATAERHATSLLELADDARTIDRMIDQAGDTHKIVLVSELIENAISNTGFSTELETSFTEDVRVATDPDLLSEVITRLLSSIAAQSASEVTVRLRRDETDTVRIEFHGENTGLEHETEAIKSGEETPLMHATGLHLWMAKWGTDILGGRIHFDQGATAILELPVDEDSTPNTSIEKR